MLPTIVRGGSILALAALAAGLGACTAEKPPTAISWSYPGEQPTATTKPLMRLATLPMNPPPAAAYADYADEPSRFVFHSHIVILDQDNGTVDDTAGAADTDDAGGQ